MRRFSNDILLGSMSTTRPAGLGFSSSSTTFLFSLWLMQGLSGVQHVRLCPFTMTKTRPVCSASAGSFGELRYFNLLADAMLSDAIR